MRADKANEKRERRWLPVALVGLCRDIDYHRQQIKHHEQMVGVILAEISKVRRRMCELKMKDI
jgi:hypothetical protein